MIKKLRLIFFFLFLFITFAGNLYAQFYQLKTFYPDPFASYQKLRLYPQTPSTTDPNDPLNPNQSCDIGKIYYKNAAAGVSDGELYYCREDINNPSQGIWGPFIGIWTREDVDESGTIYSYIYPSAIPEKAGPAPFPEGIKLGIGLEAPNETDLDLMLTVANGGILATDEAIDTLAGTRNLKDNGEGTLFIWYPKKAAFRAGYTTEDSRWADDDTNNVHTMEYYSVALGNEPKTQKSTFSTAIGTKNKINGEDIDNDYNIILGGQENLIEYDNSTEDGLSIVPIEYSAMAGGYQNLMHSSYSFIGGGTSNNRSVSRGGDYSVMVGAGAEGSSWLSETHGNFSAIAGGMDAAIHLTDPTYVGKGRHSVILNGDSVTVNGNYVTFIGNRSVVTTPPNSNNPNPCGWGFVSGTSGSSLYSCPMSHTTLFTNEGNWTNSPLVTMLGGRGNSSGPSYASYSPSSRATATFIGGGAYNSIALHGGGGSGWSVMVGGYMNKIGYSSGSTTRNYYSFMGNSDKSYIANSKYSVTIGGYRNYIDNGWGMFIGGGSNNWIYNGATYSAIPGGYQVRMGGDYSFGAGKSYITNADNTFAWGIDAGTITEPNAFVIYNGSAAELTGYIIFGNETNFNNLMEGLNINGNLRLQSTGSSSYSIIMPNPNAQAGSSVARDSGTGALLYNDIAETFQTTEDVEAGDLLVVDENAAGQLKKSSQAYDKNVIGVASGTPAVLFEGHQIQLSPQPNVFTKGTRPPVALAGRIPCKVSLENGPIEAGDLLTSSSVPGHAMKATDLNQAFHSVVGKALEPFNGTGEKETGIITILATIQ